ncbi:MAG: hypothetical protein Q8P78_02735, partial [bacterium]|nr:hypothetical protein [bacterium]
MYQFRPILALAACLAMGISPSARADEPQVLPSGTISLDSVEGLLAFHGLPLEGDAKETGIALWPLQ